VASAYDCGVTGFGCSDSWTWLTNAQTAAKNAGVRRLTTSGIQIYLARPFTLDDDMTLDGTVANPDVSNHNLSTPGTIWGSADTTTTPRTPAITLGNGSALKEVSVMPYWLGVVYQGWGASPTVPQQENVISTMIANGETGVLCEGKGCTIRDGVVAGFDTAIEVTGGGSLLEDVAADGDVCVYLHGPTNPAHWARVSCNVAATTDGPSEEVFTITGIDDDGSGSHACKLTLASTTSPSLSDISTSYYIWVSGLDTAHGANANGRWIPSSVNVLSGTVVLAQSACTAVGSGPGHTLNGPSATASFANGTQTIQLASSTGPAAIANIIEGQTASGTGIASGSIVKAIAKSTNCTLAMSTCILVGLSKATNSAQPSATVQFSSTSFSSGGTTCTIHGVSGSTGTCLMLTAQERVDVGQSDGGVAASGISGSSPKPGCATGFLIGGFSSSSAPTYACQSGAGAAETVAGFDVISPFCYAYAICYHLANAYNARLISAGMDATRNLSDEDTAFGIIDGQFKGISFLGGKAGKVGAGLVINPSGTDKGCVNVSSQDLSVYEVDQGCLLSRGLDGANTLIVSDNASAVQVGGYSPNLNVYKQDATPAHLASSLTDTSGVSVQAGSTWWGGQICAGRAGADAKQHRNRRPDGCNRK